MVICRVVWWSSCRQSTTKGQLLPGSYRLLWVLQMASITRDSGVAMLGLDLTSNAIFKPCSRQNSFSLLSPKYTRPCIRELRCRSFILRLTFSSARFRSSMRRFDALRKSGCLSVSARSTASRRAQFAPLPNMVEMLTMSAKFQIRISIRDTHTWRPRHPLE